MRNPCYLCLEERVVLFTHRTHDRLTDLHKWLVLQKIKRSQRSLALLLVVCLLYNPTGSDCYYKYLSILKGKVLTCSSSWCDKDLKRGERKKSQYFSHDIGDFSKTVDSVRTSWSSDWFYPPVHCVTARSPFWPTGILGDSVGQTHTNSSASRLFFSLA